MADETFFVNILVLLLLSSAVFRVLGVCEDEDDCGGCMHNPDCVWCKDLPPLTFSRCLDRQSEEVTLCRSIVDIDSNMTVVENNFLSLSSDGSNIVQIQPQSVQLNLRPGKAVNVSLTVGHASNFPVDLYFLMDLSWSMRSSRDILTEVTGDIIQAIEKKSDDVKLGFGSFIDKNVAPFTSAVQEFNCNRHNPNCTPPYSFYHQQRLENITPEDFKKAVMEAPLAGNVDDPEGSLDALMQSMVCTERVGWRDDSRKLIVLFTDRDFHFALDGKLAGILPPNDGICHLNDTGNGSGYYTMGEIQDYPSVGQISKVAQQNNFILLFAVNEHYKHIYQGMVDQIPGSSVDILSKDGSNMVEIVETKYNQISTSLTLSPGYSPGTRVRFFSRCTGSELRETRSCSDVKISDPIQFVVEVSIDSCDFKHRNLPINLLGSNARMMLDIHPECECPCQSQIPTEVSDKCSGRGKLVCGACQCNQDSYGEQCQCFGSNQSGEDQCKKDSDGAVCSGRGECTCGTCFCNQDHRGIISGRYCECDDWSCPKSREGRLCNGKGKCKCGICACEDGWTGSSCECPVSEENCVSPYDGEVCSGHGSCQCGTCTCTRLESENGMYTGKYCERNPIDGTGACDEVRECVECQNFPQEDSQADCDKCVFQSNVIEVSGADTPADVGGTQCNYVNNNQCSYSYILGLDLLGKPIVSLISRDGKIESCGTPLGLTLGVGAGVVVAVIGLITICIYKICIEVRDRQQYAKFVREEDFTRNAVNQMPNEIYKSPITKFKNPTYGQ